MENGYWHGRKRASLTAARNAVSAEARLIHYDLAGRYSLNAVSAESQAIHVVGPALPIFHANAHKSSPKKRSDT